MPRDFVWLYPAGALVLLFPVLVAVLRRRRAESPDHAGVGASAMAFAAMASAVLVVDYAVQLAVVQPSLLRGETEGLSLISQYNPHGVFIVLEDVGYLLMAFAFLGIAPLLTGPSRRERVARRVFRTGGLLTPAALVVLAVGYRADLEYRFELAALSIDWLVLIVAGALLAVLPGRVRTEGG